jgi:predicted RNA-binding protein YlxR (DUF448 family)
MTTPTKTSTPLQALPRKQNSEDSALVPMSFVNLSGSSKPGARAPRVRSTGKRDDGRALKARRGGAAQRVRQKATRERRRFSDGGRKVVERTCVGCSGTGSAEELLRVVVAPSVHGEISSAEQTPSGVTLVVDLGNKLPGRGAWVHPQPACIERACSRGFAKAFASAVRTTATELFEQLRGAAERRLAGLLLASFRSRQAVYGRDAVKEVLGQAPLVIMALDAQAVAKDGDLQRAGLAGKVVLWSTKAQLGHWLGRSEVGVVAITERSIAEVMRKTIALASLASVPRGSVAGGSGRLVSAAADGDAADEGADSAASHLECDAVAGSSASGSGASESSAVRDEE